MKPAGVSAMTSSSSYAQIRLQLIKNIVYECVLMHIATYISCLGFRFGFLRFSTYLKMLRSGHRKLVNTKQLSKVNVQMWWVVGGVSRMQAACKKKNCPFLRFLINNVN